MYLKGMTKITIYLYATLALLCAALSAQDDADQIYLPIASGPQLHGILELIDSSQGRWLSLRRQLSQADENGFEASFSAASGESIDVRGKFERAGDALKCSLQWEANTELPEGFIMLVLRLPIESCQDCVVGLRDGQTVREISMAKLLAGEPTRTSMENISSFSLGPIDGKKVIFSSDDLDTPLGVEVIKTDTDFHLRFLLTPRKSSLPATGSVIWTMATE